MAQYSNKAIDWTTGIWFPEGVENPRHCFAVQTASGPRSNGGSFHGGKAAKADHSSPYNAEI